jgi:hypothetical protein
MSVINQGWNEPRPERKFYAPSAAPLGPRREVALARDEINYNSVMLQNCN